ncbi:MAG: alpha/beta hydrolase [Bryobacteraceae bacterium]|nr:alpha/beta hydrolase [Bryobacteraceae bacterium]
MQPSIASSRSGKSLHRSGFVTANGIRLHYLDWGGTGPALILIHGFRANPHFFDDLAPAFKGRFRVIAYARRGHGESEASGPYDLATLTVDLRGLMDALGIDKAHLAGHSMGGNEITSMAGAHPGRVGRIVYLDSAYDWADPAFVAAFQNVPAAYSAPPASAFVSLDAARAYLQTVWWPGVDGSRLEAYMRGGLAVQPDGTVRSIMRDSVVEEIAAAMFTETRDYTRVRAPALAIYPETNLDVHHVSAAQAAENLAWERQYIAPFRQASVARARRELSNVEILNVPGTHLDFLFTSRDKVVDAMQRFLDAPGSSCQA